MECKTDSLIVLIQKQVKDYLKSDEYGYEELKVYVKGTPDPFEFDHQDDFKFDLDKGLLIVTQGPTDQHENKGVPEIVILFEAIVASQLA